MNKYFTIFIWISILYKNYCECKISISPKSSVLRGERVTISCTIPRPKISMLWYHNNKNICEDETCYNSKFAEVTKFELRFDLIIRNVTLEHRGNWKCHSSNGDFLVQLNVSVPWTLKATSIKKLPPPAHHSKTPLNITCDDIETGEKRWPYNLQMNTSLVVTCESECGLPGPKSISVQYSNTSKSGELRGGTQKLENCEHNTELQKLTHTVTVNCLEKSLVGRNEIRCQSEDSNGNFISNKPVFILCPPFAKPDILTHGEIVAIAISIVLASVDIIIIVFLLRRNCRALSNSHYKFDKSNGSEVML